MPGVFMHRLHILMTVTQSIEREVFLSTPLWWWVVKISQNLFRHIPRFIILYYQLKNILGFFLCVATFKCQKKGEKTLGGQEGIKEGMECVCVGCESKGPEKSKRPYLLLVLAMISDMAL
jgi:hypothetical protein